MNKRDISENKKPSCRKGGPTVPPLFESQHLTSSRGKMRFPSDCSRIHAMMALLYQTLQSTLEHDMAIR